MNYQSSVLLTVCLALLIAGCGTPKSAEGTKEGGNKSNTHQGHQHGSSSDSKTEMEQMKAELAKLSPEDAASAEKQHICPVSDKMLGSMGAPIKVSVNDREIWICCAGCKQQVLKEPAKYLAKIDKAK